MQLDLSWSNKDHVRAALWCVTLSRQWHSKDFAGYHWHDKTPPSMLSLSARMSWEQTFGWITADLSLWLTESLGILLMLIMVDTKFLGPRHRVIHTGMDSVHHSPPSFCKYPLVREQFSNVHFPNLLLCWHNHDFLTTGFLLMLYYRNK